MKKTIIIFISYVTLLGTFLPGVVQGAISSQEAPSPAFIYPNPVIPLPKNQGGNNNVPQSGQSGGNQLELPEVTEEQKKCLVSFVNKGMSTCLEDLGNSFVTSKIKVRPECCSALDGLTDQCRLAIHFQNQGFEDLVQNYCASGGAMAPGASGPAEGPGSEGGYQDGSFPDMTGQMDAGFGSAFGPGPSEGPSEGPSSYGSVGESDGPSLAEGPSTSESTEDIGHIIENATPTNGETLAEEGEPETITGTSAGAN